MNTPVSDNIKRSDTPKEERLAKRMAGAGLCSRREAERWIEEGRVTINGQVVTTPATLVTDKTAITVDGKPLNQAPRLRVWLHYKPAGLLTTHHDPQGRPTIFQNLPSELFKETSRVISIGRLDLNSEGLILLTNAGALARYAELPASGWPRAYRVRVFGKVNERALAELAQGITIDGLTYGTIEAEVEHPSPRERSSNTWLSLTLYEGKNREIRKVMEYLGLRVNRLIRIAYGPFSLANLEIGQVKEAPWPNVLQAFPFLQEEKPLSRTEERGRKARQAITKRNYSEKMEKRQDRQ